MNQRKIKAVILAGGLGSRLSEETQLRPKPMVEIAGKPILFHIMKNLSQYGINSFIICLGYKGYMIKEFFVNYRYHLSNFTINLSTNDITIHNNNAENWNVTLVDTGEFSLTGGRIKRISDYLDDQLFLMTYGDGLSDIDINLLIDSHIKSKKLATISAVQPPGRFGSLSINNNHEIIGFEEKPKGDGGYINGGFFVLDPKIIKYIDNDMTVWEQEPLKALAREGKLNAYIHRGFWAAMDTLRDKNYLEELWIKNKAPWKNWK